MRNAQNTPIENKSRKTNRSIRAEKRKEKEAKARRKVNEDWQRMELTGKYREAAAKSIGMNTTEESQQRCWMGFCSISVNGTATNRHRNRRGCSDA